MNCESPPFYPIDAHTDTDNRYKELFKTTINSQNKEFLKNKYSSKKNNNNSIVCFSLKSGSTPVPSKSALNYNVQGNDSVDRQQKVEHVGKMVSLGGWLKK